MPRKRLTTSATPRTDPDVWTVIAHDLRQPVQAMALIAKAAATEAADAGQRGLCERLSLLAQSLDSMIDAMGEFAALESGTRTLELRPARLEAIVDAAVTKVAAAARAEGCTVHHSGLLGEVRTDVRMLAMVLEGVLLFCVKSGRAGEIVIRARRTKRTATLDFEYAGAAPENAMTHQAFIELKPIPASPPALVQGVGLALAARLAPHLGAQLRHSRIRDGRHRVSVLLPVAG